MNKQKYAAEAIGTFWLTFGGCGSAVIAAGVPAGRDRPARRVARLRADRGDNGLRHRPHLRLPPQPGGDRRPRGGRPVPGRTRSLPYIVAQVVGAIVAAAVLYLIASGAPGFDLAKASPPTATASIRPGNTACSSVPRRRGRADDDVPVRHHGRDARQGAGRLRAARDRPRPDADPPVSIPVTNTSVNPARSTGPALFVGGWALAQLWLFWVAPILGGAARRHAVSLAQRGAFGTDCRRSRPRYGLVKARMRGVAGSPLLCRGQRRVFHCWLVRRAWQLIGICDVDPCGGQMDQR